MRFIENTDLREWVKDNLRKAIFQKAHALAVQTGCEVLVKLEDSSPLTDKQNSCQYYATKTIQNVFKSSGVREKTDDVIVCGETGLPMTPTVDSAVQSVSTSDYTDTLITLTNVTTTEDRVNMGSSPPSESNLDSLRVNRGSSSPNDTNLDSIRVNRGSSQPSDANVYSVRASRGSSPPSETNLDSVRVSRGSSPPNDTNLDSIRVNRGSSPPGDSNLDSVFPLELKLTSEPSKISAPLNAARSTAKKSTSQARSEGQSDGVLDFSRKTSQGEVDFEETSSETSSNNVSMETDQSQMAALVQQSMDGERYTCQICGRNFPKQQLLRDHMSRSHMQPNMPLVIQASQPMQSSIGPVPAAGLDHVPSDSPPPSDLYLSLQTYPVPLPSFSSLIQTSLDDGSIQKVWDLFIRESTDFYFSDMPTEDGKARTAYQNIGRTMYEKYPCVGSKGQNPWSNFNKSLSNKMRWRRQKRKSVLEPGGGGRPPKRPNSTPSPASTSPTEELPHMMTMHSEEDVKPDINELNRRILLAQQVQQQVAPTQYLLHIPGEPSQGRMVVGQLHPFPISPSPSRPSTSMAPSPPIIDYGIPAKGLKKNILMQTGFYLTPDLAALGFSSTLKMTTEKVIPLLKQMSKEGYGIWVEDPVDKNKCGFIKWYPLNDKQRAEVNLTNEQYKRACVAKPQQPRVLSREMEQFFDACGGRKVRQNMSLL